MNCRRAPTRPVSCYALLGRVAASGPTSWLSARGHILCHSAVNLGPWRAVWAVSLSSAQLSPRALTRGLSAAAVRSLVRFGRLRGPLGGPVLYRRRLTAAASPKAISGRTSYLHVRLEFHPYPHLILTLFNGYRFGPPHIFTCASAWTWVDHCGFGSMQSNLSPY